MQGITNINYVSKDSPNILLIADHSNQVHSGIHLKHFKHTHNIYTLLHDFKEEDFHWFYKDLPSHHEQIIAELNKNNLYKFTISSLSFGGLMAYYMMFYMPDRVEKVFIQDYHWNSTQRIINKQVNVSNWNIPKQCSVPIVVNICRGLINGDWNNATFLSDKEIVSLWMKFISISFIFTFSRHTLLYDNKAKKRVSTLLLNGFSNKYYWDKLYKKWMNNQPIYRHKLPIIVRLLIYLGLRKVDKLTREIDVFLKNKIVFLNRGKSNN